MSRAKMTAEYASAVRALGAKERDLPCPDYLAEKLISFKYRVMASSLFRGLTIRLLHSRFPNLYAFHMVRTLFIDSVLNRLIAEDEIGQVVILGAGLDTRGIRFRESGCRFFELDFPGTQALKRERVDRLRKKGVLDDSHVVYIPIDFNESRPFDELQRRGFDSAKRTLVIWEGVTMYLPEETIHSVLSDIRRETPLGSYLVFDYLLPQNIQGNNEQGDSFVKKLNEEYVFGINPNELSDFVSPLGFEVEENMIHSDLNDAYLDVVESRYLHRALKRETSPALALLKTV